MRRRFWDEVVCVCVWAYASVGVWREVDFVFIYMVGPFDM